nr:hypothetical protein [Burkholderiaceae bacterium]
MPPADAEVVSHKLMLRAGMIKQQSAGIYSWLPLGHLVLRNIAEIGREEQDRFAIASTARAKAANTDGSFGWEIAALTVAGRKGEVTIDKDESPF